MTAQGCLFGKYIIYVKVSVPCSCQWGIQHLPVKITTLDDDPESVTERRGRESNWGEWHC